MCVLIIIFHFVCFILVLFFFFICEPKKKKSTKKRRKDAIVFYVFALLSRFFNSVLPKFFVYFYGYTSRIKFKTQNSKRIKIYILMCYEIYLFTFPRNSIRLGETQQKSKHDTMGGKCFKLVV